MKIHELTNYDRYIVIDYGAKDTKVFHSGASVKDAGEKITTITQFTDISDYKNTAKKLLKTSVSVLR